MAEDLHPIFGADADQKFAVAAKIARTQGCLAVKVRDIAEHFAPLACQQIYDIDPLGFALQECGLRAEEVDVGVRCDPACFAPLQTLIPFESKTLALRRYLN